MFIKITTEPLSVQALNDLVKRASDGAVVTFDGIVRRIGGVVAVDIVEVVGSADKDAVAAMSHGIADDAVAIRASDEQNPG